MVLKFEPWGDAPYLNGMSIMNMKCGNTGLHVSKLKSALRIPIGLLLITEHGQTQIGTVTDSEFGVKPMVEECYLS